MIYSFLTLFKNCPVTGLTLAALTVLQSDPDFFVSPFLCDYFCCCLSTLVNPPQGPRRNPQVCLVVVPPPFPPGIIQCSCSLRHNLRQFLLSSLRHNPRQSPPHTRHHVHQWCHLHSRPLVLLRCLRHYQQVNPHPHPPVCLQG